MLAVLIARAKEVDQVGGLIPHLVDGGVSILQYMDDTVIFMEHDMAKARNLKLVLCLFEQLSGLKINFNKNELIYFGRTKDEQEDYRQLFVCELGPSLLVIWEYQFTTTNSQTRSGKIDLRRN